MVFLAIPAVLAFLFLIPQGVKDQLIMQISAPTPLSVFASNFVHSDAMHFLGNLVFYLLACFVLFNIEPDVKRFRLVLVALLVVVPILASVVTLYAMPKLKTSQGFSAVVAGLIGYVLFCTYAYIKETVKPKHEVFFAPMLLLFSLALAVWNMNQITSIVLIVIFWVLAYFNREVISSSLKLLRDESVALVRSPRRLVRIYYGLIFALWVLFAFLSLPGLLTLSVQNGAISNVIAHYTGYVCGWTIPMFIAKRH